MNRCILCLCLLVQVGLRAQLKEEFQQYRDRFPDAHSVRLINEARVTLMLKNGQLDIMQETREENLYMDRTAGYNSEESIHFSTFYEMESIEASSIVEDKGGEKEFKVSDFKVKDELTDSFYDDVQSINFVYPNLKEGARTKITYRQRIKDPRFLSTFYLGDFKPVERSTFSLVADKAIEMDFLLFNTEGMPLKFEKEEGRRKVTYTWTLENSEAYKYEEDIPTFKKILPHIIPIVRSYESEGKSVQVLGDVDKLYGWYYSLVEGINSNPTDQNLVALVKELTDGLPNDLDKVRALYYWTQENIKYIDFEYALGGFVPREANDIFKNKYGDCKDNSSLLQVMLELAGLKGYLAWIGTRDIPYTYEEVPTPVVDNHMILAYLNGNTTYFLDATGRYNPIEFPTSFIQGKEALIGISADSMRLVEVPVIPADKNLFADKITVRLDGNSLIGEGTARFSGYPKSEHFYALEQRRKQDDVLDLYNSVLEKGNNSFLIRELHEKGKFDYDEDFQVAYSFEVSNYATTYGGEIYVNLNMNRLLSHFRTDEERVHPKSYDFKRSFILETEFLVPEGYAISYLPPSYERSDDGVSVRIDYFREENSITYRHEVRTDFLERSPSELKKLNSFIKEVEKQYKEVVILAKSQNRP